MCHGTPPLFNSRLAHVSFSSAVPPDGAAFGGDDGTDALRRHAGCGRVLTRFAANQAAHLSVRVVKVDTDALPALAAKHGGSSVPSFVLFQGGKEVHRVTGYKPALLKEVFDKAK